MKDKQKQILSQVMNEDSKDGLYHIGDTNKMVEHHIVDSNKMITAVEWLLQQIESKNGKEFSSYYTEFIEQTKTMEKEQMAKAFNEGMLNSVDYFGNGVDEAEQYYNETYNK